MKPDPEDIVLSAADVELERALSGLRPAATLLDAPAAWFEAGRQAGRAEAGRPDLTADRCPMERSRRSIWRWRAVAAVLAVVAGVSLARNFFGGPATTEPLPRPIAHDDIARPSTERAPAVAVYPMPAVEPLTGEPSLLRLRTLALAEGIESLPRQHFGTTSEPLRVGQASR